MGKGLTENGDGTRVCPAEVLAPIAAPQMGFNLVYAIRCELPIDIVREIDEHLGATNAGDDSLTGHETLPGGRWRRSAAALDGGGF